MRRGQGAGEDGGELSVPVDRHIDGEMGRSERHRGAHEVVHGIPLTGDERGVGVGDAPRMVCLEDGLGGGQSRAHGLGPATETGEEVRLDEPGDDAEIGLDIVALQEDGHAEFFDAIVEWFEAFGVDAGIVASTCSALAELWSTMA